MRAYLPIFAVFALTGMSLFGQETDRPTRQTERRERTEIREADSTAASKEKFGTRIRELVEAGKLTREEAGELFRLAFPERETPRRRGRNFEVKDPAEFSKLQEHEIFSGPQAGEIVTGFTATGINGEFEGKKFNPIKESNGKPLLLMFQDESGVGFRGLAGWSRAVTAINEQENVKLDVCVVFLGDDPAALTESTRGMRRYLGDKIIMAVSQDGRDGPGQLGLNRNVAMTALLVNNGKVQHNFAFTQPQLTPDPHALGGVAELIGTDRQTLHKWLSDGASAQQRMRMKRN